MTNTDKSLLLHYHVDNQGNPTAIKIENESKQASSINYCVQLQQVPDEQHRMVVVDDLGNELIEVYNMDEIKENNYYINYTSSVVWFHPSKAGKTFIFNYFGMGLELIGASRIYDETTYVGEFIIRTIQEIIDKGRECIEALSTVGNAVQVLHRLEEDIATGTILHNDLLQDIATGNQLVIDLNNTIEIGSLLNTDLGVTINTANTSKTELETTTTNANNKKIELEGTISTANTSKTNLENATATADAKKTELDTSIANAQDDINTINARGNDSYIVLSTNWVGTEPNLTYVLNHGLNSKNLIVGAINDDTKFSSMPDFKYIDMNTIELQSTTRSNITVSINANYYSGKDANTVSQEVIDARDGEISLKGKIENINTSINALNTEIITARGSDLTLDERLDGIDLVTNEVEKIQSNIPYSDFNKENIISKPMYKLYDGSSVFANKFMGTHEKGCSLSAIIGENNPRPQVMGTDTKGLANYTSRDSVAFYSHNRYTPPAMDLQGCEFTFNGMNVPLIYNLSTLKEGMIVDTKTTPKCVGIIASIVGNVVTMVDGWYKYVTDGGNGNRVTPSGDSCYVNKITKIWGINNNIIIEEGCNNGVAEEIGVICNNPSISEVGGIDLINMGLSTHFGYKARGKVNKFQKSFINEGSWQGFNNEKVSKDGIALINTNTDNELLYRLKNDGTMTKLKGEMQIMSSSGQINNHVVNCLCNSTGVIIDLPTSENGKIINIFFTVSGCSLRHTNAINTKYKVATTIQCEKGGCTLMGDGTFWYAINSECVIQTQ